MIYLSKLIVVDKTSSIAVYLQIANAISSLIQKGLLLPGVKVQTTRQLSQHLGLHRKTVVAAYEELLVQGWLQSKPRKGFYVTKKLPVATPVSLTSKQSSMEVYPGKTNFALSIQPLRIFSNSRPVGNYRYTFNDGFPDVRLAPLDALLKEYSSIGKKKLYKKLLTYSDKRGSLHLRQQLALNLRETRGMAVSEENIFISKGAQMAIFMVASLLLKPGDGVIVGAPNYFLVNLMLERLGVQLHYVPVDDDGLQVNKVEALCKKKKIRMIYVIPHHHHPTTVALSAERRKKLLQIAEEHNIAIIEDDYDFDIHYNNTPILPMASIDRAGNVIYIGTLTKTFAPAIRVGFIVAPRELIDLLAEQRYLIDLQGDTLLEEAIAEMYKNGAIARHMKKIRRVYKERRDFFCEAMNNRLGDAVTFRVPEGGMSVWVHYTGVDTTKISEAALKYHLFVSDGKRHNTNKRDFNSMCMGFASMTVEEMTQAVHCLQQAVRLALKR
jgi:GntR family transcriptional regulator/MocR family aminotransferase